MGDEALDDFGFLGSGSAVLVNVEIAEDLEAEFDVGVVDQVGDYVADEEL